jgi:hypothetical protein
MKEGHEVAGLFELMKDSELRDLADDIREHGLLEPIVMFEGKVLDGRNRQQACELAGVEATYVEWEPNGQAPTEYVLSKNLLRRHLTDVQRAALSVEVMPKLKQEAKSRQRASGGGKGRAGGDERTVSRKSGEPFSKGKRAGRDFGGLGGTPKPPHLIGPGITPSFFRAF